VTEVVAGAGAPDRALLEVRGLRARYGPEREILKGIDFTVSPGDFLVVIGPSGSGKSTLIRCINRLVEPTAGEVWFGGQNVTELAPAALRHARRHIGMIFQGYNLVDRMSVIDNVLAGRLGYTGALRSLTRSFTDEEELLALQLLERVGLADLADRRADRLSGGQRQRVGIARALIQNPKLLLVDEPTSSLDPKIAREAMRLIHEVAAEYRIPVVCNMHDVDLALEFCTHVIGLQDGSVRFEGAPGEIDRAVLADIYAMEVL
jgi:phosphonate transport system ATP-binding protein